MDRKAEIIGLADQLVKSVGYEGFSYADLSDKLGITKASIHHHFPHKEDLGAALCDSYAAYLEKKFRAIEASAGDAWSKLDAYFTSGAALVEDHGKTCPISALQAEVNSLPAALKDRLRALDGQELGFVARVLETGRASGEFRFQGGAAAQAALLVSSYKGALSFSRIHGCAFLKDVMEQMKRSLGL
ncbi:TetR/AcrR family transcriptional regulator [bacterium]|nr:MAG: TetR/AcrR family transcriptional regulator [bacterium]